MRQKNILPVIISILLMLVFSSLACNLPLTNIVSDTSRSTQADLQENQSNIPQQENTEESASVTLTESQINSLMAQLVEGNNSMSNVQVRLEEGKIVLTGMVRQGNMNLPLSVDFQVQADGQGGVDIEILNASVGPLPIPQSMRTEFQDQINQGFDSLVPQLTQNMYIENIAVSTGMLTVTGRMR